MFNWNFNDFEDRFYELGKEVETFAEELKEKYNFLHSVKDKDQRTLVEKKINDLIDNFKYKVSSLGDDVESEIEEKNDYIGDLEDQVECLDTNFCNYDEWIQHCIETLPGKASLGQAIEMEARLREII